MVFNWSLGDSKSPQVSRTFLSILVVLNNAVVWMVSARPPTSSPFNNPLVNVPKAPITIGIVITFMLHSFFFQFPSKVQVLILLFTFFQFYFVVDRNSKVDNFASSLFFCWLLLGLVFWLRLGDPSVCQSPKGSLLLLLLLLLLLFTLCKFFTPVSASGASLDCDSKSPRVL